MTEQTQKAPVSRLYINKELLIEAQQAAQLKLGTERIVPRAAAVEILLREAIDLVSFTAESDPQR